MAAPVKEMKHAATLGCDLWTIPAVFHGDGSAMMKIRRRGRRQPTKTLETVAWPSAHVLERVRHLNDKCLSAVVSNATDDKLNTIKVMARFRDLWLRMDDEARKRAAHCPVLLFELHFENAKWWHWVAHGGPRPVKTADATRLLANKTAAPLLREILVESCVIARSHPRAARLAFGMSPAVIAAIAELPASEIDSIAVTYSGELQLRWADNLVFWRNLLVAAIDGPEKDMAEVRLHCLQLLGSDSP